MWVRECGVSNASKSKLFPDHLSSITRNLLSFTLWQVLFFSFPIQTNKELNVKGPADRMCFSHLSSFSSKRNQINKLDLKKSATLKRKKLLFQYFKALFTLPNLRNNLISKWFWRVNSVAIIKHWKWVTLWWLGLL